MHYTDQSYLKERQYKDASSLDARIALHRRFGEREVNWHRWVFDHFDTPQTSHVLELGCGPGSLWLENAERIPKGWRITLSDLSSGMVEEAKSRLEGVPHDFEYAVVDAQEIPFEADLFDMVIANHMFHHVPDVNRACAEIRRVLEPNGRFYGAMNADTHLRELSELAAHLMDGASLHAFRKIFDSQFMRLERCKTLLKEHFGEVRVHRSEQNDLYVTEAEPLIAYILSMNSSEVFKKGPEEEVRERLEFFKTYLNAQIAERGAIHITRATGLLEAHSPK